MAKRIVYTRPDGGVSVVVPTGAVPLETVLAKDIPSDAINVRLVEHIDIPADRTFRNEWENGGVLVKVNMVKARAAHLNRLREKRTPILAALDVEWSKAVAKRNQTLADQIEAKRQALRDMPQTVKPKLDAATTPDLLKAILPKELVE